MVDIIHVYHAALIYMYMYMYMYTCTNVCMFKSTHLHWFNDSLIRLSQSLALTPSHCLHTNHNALRYTHNGHTRVVYNVCTLNMYRCTCSFCVYMTLLCMYMYVHVFVMYMYIVCSGMSVIYLNVLGLFVILNIP